MAVHCRSDGCPFDQLCDELVVKVLELACESVPLDVPWDGWDMRSPTESDPLGFFEQTWGSSHSLARLSTVCHRFRALYLGAYFQDVVWKCGLSDQIGACALALSGEHLKGLILERSIQPELWRDLKGSERLSSLSIDLFSEVLSPSTKLETLCLRSEFSGIKGRDSETLWRLIAQLLLKTLWLSLPITDFSLPLEGIYMCNHLVDIRLDRALLSNSFMSSLLERLPGLRKLHMTRCIGLKCPSIKAEKLQVLDFVRLLSIGLPEIGAITRVMSIDAPNLTTLKGLPAECFIHFALHLKTPNLKTLSMDWVPKAFASDCSIRLSSLTLNARRWNWTQLEHLLSKYGASDLLDLGYAPYCEGKPLSAFLEMVPSTLASLVLGHTVSSLYESECCEERIGNLRFELLKNAKFEVSELEDVRLTCCFQHAQI